MIDPEQLPGWSEPIAESMWRYDLLFGVPRVCLLLHLAPAWLGIFYGYWWWVASGVTHGVMAAVTAIEPEWLVKLEDLLFREPGDIEP